MSEEQEPHVGAMTPNFAHAMQSLAAQAADKPRPVAPTASLTASPAGPTPTQGGGKNAARPEALLAAVGQMLKPMAVGIESLTRATMENRQLLTKLAGAAAATPPPAPPLAGLSPEQAQTLEAIAQQVGRMGSVESANQKLFDALHGELKGYKDGFLFDALQRPFIRDFINVHDEIEALHAQAAARAGGDAFAAALAENLNNTLSHLLEIFERLQVVPSRTAPGEPVDKRLHRVVGLKPAASPETSGQVLRSQRPGFLWRNERCVRPEEVVISRWLPTDNPEAGGGSGTTAPV